MGIELCDLTTGNGLLTCEDMPATEVGLGGMLIGRPMSTNDTGPEPGRECVRAGGGKAGSMDEVEH